MNCSAWTVPSLAFRHKRDDWELFPNKASSLEKSQKPILSTEHFDKAQPHSWWHVM